MTRLLPALILLFAAAPALAQDAALVKKGEALYAAQKCTICHAIGGKGNPKGPLDHVGTKLSATDLRQWIVAAPEMAAKTKATRKPVMKAYTTLSTPEVDALVAYLQSLK